MLAEVHILVYIFHSRLVVREALHKLLGLRVQIKTFIDIRTLFSVISENSSSMKQSLPIGLYVLKKPGTEKRQLQNDWLDTRGKNEADGLKKEIFPQSSATCEVMTRKELGTDWIGRETKRKDYISTRVSGRKCVGRRQKFWIWKQKTITSPWACEKIQKS